jgi:cell wall-associated NlpC family hydrolase
MTDMLEQSQSPKTPASNQGNQGNQGAAHAAAAPQQSSGSHASEHASAPVGLAESADHALQSVGSLYNAVDTVVSKQVRERPYVALAAAAGVGFILGGGMRSPFGQVLVRVGVRAFGPPLVSAALNGVIERAQGLTQQHE